MKFWLEMDVDTNTHSTGVADALRAAADAVEDSNGSVFIKDADGKTIGRWAYVAGTTAA